MPEPTTLATDAPLAAERKPRPDRVSELQLDFTKGTAVTARTVTIDRPRTELYAYWRDFSHLPQFMENIEAVTETDDRHSHWVVRAPAGQTVEWDSVLTEDTPSEAIAWASVEGSGISNSGRVEFRDSASGRGTEVTATIVYDPPGGALGQLIAKLFQREPKIQARQDLRRFKQLMETGEIAIARLPEDLSA
jgi:uncharacterized membrane protein